MIKKIAELISKIIRLNIPFFILLGFLSLFTKYELIKEFHSIFQSYILPIILAYNSGLVVEKKHGGYVAVITATTLLKYDFYTFLDPIFIGIIAGIFSRKYSVLIKKLTYPGYEMLLNNLGITLLGGSLGLISFYLFPFYIDIQMGIINSLWNIEFQNNFLPLSAVIIEPAKVFFLNNIINHSFFSVLGLNDVNIQGKSIFFLLETNPGPGLGALLALYTVEIKGENNKEKRMEIKSNIFIHFIGGIHEVYFPYILKNLRLIIGLITGSFFGIFLFQKFQVGLVSIASPGSFILLFLLAPMRDKIFVILGVMLSATISFSISYVLLINKHKSFELPQDNNNNQIDIGNISNIEICVVCDAGMGSSAMGATLLKKKLDKEGIKNLAVHYSSIDNISPSSTIVIIHRQLLNRVDKLTKDSKEFFVIDDFMDTSFYDKLILQLKSKLKLSNILIEKEIAAPLDFRKKNKRILKRENILVGLKRVPKEEAIIKVGQMLFEKSYVNIEYIDSIIEREKLASTYLDHGIAIPHCTSQGRRHIKESGIVIHQYPYGIDYGNGATAYIIVGIAAATIEDHNRIITKLASILDNAKVPQELSEAIDADEIYNILFSLEEENVK